MMSMGGVVLTSQSQKALLHKAGRRQCWYSKYVKKKKTKPTYRLRNWNRYNSSLVQRGSLTLWLSDDMIADWINQDKSGKRGRSDTYTDTAIHSTASS
jgi:hypothetical protein